ncbi:TetR/AcrR family transcriptional regulator [Lapillicoccus jejuensis]|uniref:TetR family transcriptional regulator n=1 Tax=Lapillicoccus jejuensis TaxID=402171 RepID=A0A542E147_9MICO|nr:TetR-like C-terminal domain-containing protein [Lapillicoccus jejuensis]TQJ09071.1 TetR family transcriptional regulator [Lapillicoccus jejuensis]
MSAPARATYHHGNLREALVEAGLELTRAGGPSALVLRDVTRRVGVSPNAAYRHFADRDALLAAVAAAIQEGMVARMQSARGGRRAPPDPVRALRAVGLGYVDFALAEPGWFETAFGMSSALPGGPAPQDVDALPPADRLPAPLARLVEALDGLVEAGLLSPRRRRGAEWPCWSAVHGYALLALGGPLRGQPPRVLRREAERTVDAIIAGLLA